MFTPAFWKDLAERAIASAAGGAVTAMGGAALGVIETDWIGVASFAAGTAIFSVLKALAATRRGDPESASLVR